MNELESADIDFKLLAYKLQSENEQLRIHILKLRNAKFGLGAAITSGNVKHFLVSNYMVIGAVGTLFFIGLSLVETIKEFTNTSRSI